MEESRRGTVETGAMPQQLCQMARAAGAKTVALGGGWGGPGVEIWGPVGGASEAQGGLAGS